MTGPASASVRPAVRKRPNVIVVEPRKTADRPVICPVNVVPMPQVEVHKSRCVGTCSGELFPEEPKVVPAEMAKRPARRALRIYRTLRGTGITSSHSVRR